MVDYKTVLVLEKRCLAELGKLPPPVRFQTLEDSAAEIEAALKAGKVPKSWSRPWGRVEGTDRKQ